MPGRLPGGRAATQGTLVWELGKERVTEDDITSLPVHHCYVRATVGIERMPAFSMMVQKARGRRPRRRRAASASAASAYTLTEQQVTYGDAEGDQKVRQEFQKKRQKTSRTAKAQRRTWRSRRPGRRSAEAAEEQAEAACRRRNTTEEEEAERMRTEGCEARTAQSPGVDALPRPDWRWWPSPAGRRPGSTRPSTSWRLGRLLRRRTPRHRPASPHRPRGSTSPPPGWGRLAEEEEAWPWTSSSADRPRLRPVAAQPDGSGSTPSPAIYRLAAQPSPASHTPYGSGGTGPSTPGRRRRRFPMRPHRRHRQAGAHRRPDRLLQRRMWRLRQGPLPGAVLVLMADDAAAQARPQDCWLGATDVPCPISPSSARRSLAVAGRPGCGAPPRGQRLRPSCARVLDRIEPPDTVSFPRRT